MLEQSVFKQKKHTGRPGIEEGEFLMSISLGAIYSPQSFSLPVGGTPSKKLYSCTGFASFSYAGTSNPSHDTLTFALVDNTGNPLTLPANEVLEKVTATISLNSIGAVPGNGNTTWAADTASIEMDENNRQL